MALRTYKSKKDCIHYLRKIDPDISEIGPEMLENMVFKHHRTYSLNSYGKFVLTKYFEHYVLPFECQTIKERVMLNRVFDMPYHYCNKAGELTLFNKELSFLIKLCGDASTWLEQEISMRVK
jgi:hypothetical protein